MPRHHATIEEWERWIPDVDEERALFATGNEAISMELRHLTKRERESFARLAKVARKSRANADRFEEAARSLFADNVRKVEHYSIDEEPIRDGADLYDRGDEDVKEATVRALLHRPTLDEGLAKKLSGRRDSSSPRPSTSSVGSAPDATRRSSPTTQDTQTTPTPISDSPTEQSGSSEIATATTPTGSSPVGRSSTPTGSGDARRAS